MRLESSIVGSWAARVEMLVVRRVRDYLVTSKWFGTVMSGNFGQLAFAIFAVRGCSLLVARALPTP